MNTENLTAGDPIPAQHLRKMLPTVMLIAAGSFCAVAISINIWKSVGPPSWGPRIACESPRFDFGTVPAGESVDHEFVIENTGRAELIVHNVVTSCSCLAAPLMEATIPAGDSLILPVRVTLASTNSPQLKARVVVESNDPVHPQVVLTVTGQILPASLN